ncbi:MAG: EamA family transporter [Streptosporangiaceae bacterium]
MSTAGTSAVRSGPGGIGVTLAVLSAATFGTSGTFGTSLIQAGWSPAAAVVARITASALMLTVPAVLQLRGRWFLLRREAGRVIAFGLVAVAGCQLFYFNAIQRMPVGVALLLEYMGVVLVVGWLWLRHGQRPRRLTVTGAVAAIAGLVLVLNLTGPDRVSPVGVMWGLLAAVGLAIYFMLSAAAGDESLPPLAMAWAGMCVGGTVLAGLGWAGVLRLAATTSPVDMAGHRVSWLLPVLGLSLVAAVIAYVAGIGAARRLGPKLGSFFGMGEVLFAILFAWLLLGQLPSAMQFLGGACIVAGIMLVRVDEMRGSRQPAGQPQQQETGPRLSPRRQPVSGGPAH